MSDTESKLESVVLEVQDLRNRVTQMEFEAGASSSMFGPPEPMSRPDNDNPVIDTIGGGLNWASWCFGYSISGANITVHAGEFALGSNTPVAVAEATKTIAADNSYIGVKYVDATTTLTIENFGTTKPVSTGAQFQGWIYLVSLTNGAASIASPGGINIIGLAISVAARYGG